MPPPVPDAFRFPEPPEAWTHASDEVLAAFVAQVVVWRDRVVLALADGQALAGRMTERGRVVFAAALRREPAPELGAWAPRFPEVSDASRVAFEDIMEWRECFAHGLVVDQDLIDPSHHRRDASWMGTCLRPAGPEKRCDECALRETDGHRCPMSPWCDPPPSVGSVRPFPDRLRFPAPPIEGLGASDRALGAFVKAVLVWRRRVVAALRKQRDALPDTLTDLAASYLLSALSPELPLVSSWTPRFPADVEANRRGCTKVLKWREWFVTSLHNARTEEENRRILTSREERVLRQFMRPPDGDPRCSLCLAPYSRAGKQWAHRCPTLDGSADPESATSGPGAIRSDLAPSMSRTPTIALVIGGCLLLCVAVFVPATAPQGVVAGLGALAVAVGIFLYLR